MHARLVLRGGRLGNDRPYSALRAPWGQYIEILSVDRPLVYESEGGPRMYSTKSDPEPVQ